MKVNLKSASIIILLPLVILLPVVTIYNISGFCPILLPGTKGQKINLNGNENIDASVNRLVTNNLNNLKFPSFCVFREISDYKIDRLVIEPANTSVGTGPYLPDSSYMLTYSIKPAGYISEYLWTNSATNTYVINKDGWIRDIFLVINIKKVNNTVTVLSSGSGG